MKDYNEKEKNFVSAVIYCHNDAGTINEFIQGVNRTLDENFQKYEMIVVNDASNDDSHQVLKQTAASLENKTITLLNFNHSVGLEKAMNAGLDLAIGDFVYEFDSAVVDFEWSLLLDVYKKSTTQNFDVVSARSQKKPLLASKLFYHIFNHYARFPFPLHTESFRIVSRRAINRIHKNTKSIPYRKAAYASCGLMVSYIEYKPIKDVVRKKQLGRKQTAYDSMVLFTDVAYRATGGLAIFVSILAVVMLIYAIYGYCNTGILESWMIAGSLLAFGFMCIFVVLAIILKYIQTFVTLYFNKNSYLFDSIEKLQ